MVYTGFILTSIISFFSVTEIKFFLNFVHCSKFSKSPASNVSYTGSGLGVDALCCITGSKIGTN